MKTQSFEDLLKILACPECQGRLEACNQEKALVCVKCRLVYPIKEGIPVLLVEEAGVVGAAKATCPPM